MTPAALRQAVVLCGGRGSRLAPTVGELPKVLVPLAGRPLLARLLDDLAAAGTREVLLLAGWRGEQVADAAARLGPAGLAVRTRIERAPRGTAGALHEVRDALRERFVLVYGDVHTRLDWRRLAGCAEAQDGLATLVVHRTDHPGDSDVVALDPDYRLSGWRRAGGGGGAPPGALGNAGVAVLRRDVLDRIPPDRPTDLTGDVLPPLVDLRAPIYGYPTCEYVRDVGTPARLAGVEADVRAGRDCLRAELVLLDRDGVLNEEVGFLSEPEKLRLLPGAGAALRRLNAAGVSTALVTNQPVVARGLCSRETLGRIFARLDELLAAEGARLDAAFHCPHHPETRHEEGLPELRGPCRCRKPSTGLVDDALAASERPAWRAVVIGDRSSDLQLALNAGLASVAVDTGAGCRDGHCPARPTWRFPDLAAAVDWIVAPLP